MQIEKVVLTRDEVVLFQLLHGRFGHGGVNIGSNIDEIVPKKRTPCQDLLQFQTGR